MEPSRQTTGNLNSREKGKAMWSKSEEIEALKKIIEGVPSNSYLADFLAGSVESFGRSIANDLCFPTLAQIFSDREEEAKAAAECRKEFRDERLKLESEIRELRRQVERSRSELDEIRSIARRLAAV